MLKCVSRYKSSLGVFQPGDFVENSAIEHALLIDSPGSFTVVDDQPEQFTTQQLIEQDKMIRRGRPPKVVADE